MMIPPDIREQVRLRADFACEFCGVRENDAAGLLTIDHFQPKSAGGEDDLEKSALLLHAVQFVQIRLLAGCPRLTRFVESSS